MTNASTTTLAPGAGSTGKFVWRRLEEPLQVLGSDLPGWTWLIILGVVLGLALFYVVWMYIKDSRTIGLGLAAVLGLLRLSVYAVLAIVFLLPAFQFYNTTRSESRVIVVFDVSDSMQQSDQMPTPGEDNKKPPVTRRDKIIEFLEKNKDSFLVELVKKNPVVAYRVGSRLDNARITCTKVMTTDDKMEAKFEIAGNDVVAREDAKPLVFLETLSLEERRRKDDLRRIYDMWLSPRSGLGAEEATIWAARQRVWDLKQEVEQKQREVESGASDGELRAKLDELDKAERNSRAEEKKATLASEWLTRLSLEDSLRVGPALLHQANIRAQTDRVGDGTNLSDALNSILTREGGNRLQGIVLVTDGRNTEGAFDEARASEGGDDRFRAVSALHERLKVAKIPLFVVGVGKEQVKVKIEIVDVRVPPVVQPENNFRAVVQIIGEGMPGEDLRKKDDDVALEITHSQPKKAAVPVSKDKDKKDKKDKDGKEEKKPAEKKPEEKKTEEKKTEEKKTEEKKPTDKKDDKTKKPGKEEEEELDIFLVEVNDPNSPKDVKQLQTINLGKKLTLRPPGKVELDKSNMPRVEIEWQLDVNELAKAAGIDLKDAKYSDKKWELAPTLEESELKFRLRVAADPREGRTERHVSPPTGMKVVKRPVRVLLMTSAATRDYQFVRALLVREVEKKQMELSIHLQLPPGQSTPRQGVVQDVAPERMLTDFPLSYGRAKGDLYDLSSYDVIVAYDVDWLRMTQEQIQNLANWNKKGGGLVFVPGHINTVELVRPRDGDEAERFRPLVSMLPVELADSRESIYFSRRADTPFALFFDRAEENMEFLRLDENPNVRFKDDWRQFFFGEETASTVDWTNTTPVRGFFTFYPVRSAKPLSRVVARFADPDPAFRIADQLHPYLVLGPEHPTEGRVIWLGSAEMWRLREYREVFHEKFWMKLIRYAAAKSTGAIVRPIRLEMGRHYLAGRYVEVEAKIEGPDGGPLDRSARPLINLKLPPGVPDSEIKQPIVMMPRPGANDGWFSGRFQVKSAGEYELNVKVPKLRGMESDLTESAKFNVKAVNPELDNTKPDVDLMYRLSSEADDVFLRMGSKANELKAKLEKPRLRTIRGSGPAKQSEKDEQLSDKRRLYFTLENASLIPECMVEDVQEQTSRAGHKDRWDEGFTIPGTTIKISWVLLLVVGLLSVEWLLRKLLRLA